MNKESVELTLTFSELVIINNCFNEICNGYSVRNFDEKIETTKEHAHSILSFISSKFDYLNISSENDIDLDQITANIQFSITDLKIILNVIREVIKEIEEWEFVTRVGYDKIIVYRLASNLEFVITNQGDCSNSEFTTLSCSKKKATPTYVKKIGTELKIELDKSYDVVRLSCWAYDRYLNNSSESDSDIQDILRTISTMDAGPEFELKIETLHEIADALISKGETEIISSTDVNSLEKAIHLEDKWIMCPHCFDAWENESTWSVVRCPKCNELLQRKKPLFINNKLSST